MKKIIFIAVMIIALSVSITAQDIYDPELLAQIGLSETEISEIQDIQYQAEKKNREANVEMNVLKAQLEKLLLDEHPDMDQVRKTIEATLKWRIQAETANVEARVQIREKLGTDNFEKLLRLRKRIQQNNRTNTARPNQAPNQSNQSNQSNQNNMGTGTPNSRN